MRTSPRASSMFGALCAGLVGAMLAATPMGAHANSVQNAAKHWAITPKHAQAIAKRAYPGRILFKGIKKAHDGKGRRYTFAIMDHGTVHNVVVDGSTGEVLNNHTVPKYPRRRPYEHQKRIPERII